MNHYAPVFIANSLSQRVALLLSCSTRSHIRHVFHTCDCFWDICPFKEYLERQPRSVHHHSFRVYGWHLKNIDHPPCSISITDSHTQPHYYILPQQARRHLSSITSFRPLKPLEIALSTSDCTRLVWVSPESTIWKRSVSLFCCRVSALGSLAHRGTLDAPVFGAPSASNFQNHITTRRTSQEHRHLFQTHMHRCDNAGRS